MSRCFPHPPPGFEKKSRSDHVDFQTKVKHKAKKHKKDKEDKEKGEDKKEKDRSKEKHKEKKDRKEKHIEKKKENKRDKDTNKSSYESRTSFPLAFHHEQKIEERSEDIQDSIFTQELDKRIRIDEKGAAKRLVEIFPNSVAQRKTESTNAEVAIGGPVKKDGTVKKGVESVEKHDSEIAVGLLHKRGESTDAKYPNTISVSQPMEGTGVGTFPSSGQMRNKITASIQKQTEGLNAGTVMGISVRKKVERINAGITFYSAAEKWVDNADSIVEKVVLLPKKVDNVVGITSRFEKEEVVRNSTNATERRCNGAGSSMEKNHRRQMDAKEKIEEKFQKRMKNVVNAAAVEKGMFTSTEERSCNKLEHLVVKKGAEKKIEADEKLKEKRRKEKDKSRHKDKKEKREKEQRHKEQDKAKDIVNKALVDTTRTDQNTFVDRNIKKRNGAERNGFLHENDVRPNKLPHLVEASAHISPENGWIPELTCFVYRASSLDHRISKQVKAEKHPDNKDINEINCVFRGAKEPPVDSNPSVSLPASEKVKASTPQPHPDSKYLSRIYAVPKLDEWHQSDEQEWLFRNSIPRARSKPKTRDVEPSEVWSKAKIFGSEGIIVMPYVIPF